MDQTCYEFTIFDSAGDGICCGFGNGSYTLATDDQQNIISGGDFGDSESVSFRIENNLSINELDATDLVIYPNPVGSSLNIELQTSSVYSYNIYSITGKRILNGEFEGENTSISTNALSSGVYLLQLSDENENKITKRIIKE